MVPLSELAGLIIATLIAVMGMVTLVWYPWRGPWIGRSAIWFGLFACLYGLRLACQLDLIQAYGPEMAWRYSVAFINYLILIPAGLFVDSLFGAGWKSALRRGWQGAAILAIFSIAWDLAHQRPGAAMGANRLAVLLLGSLVIAHLLLVWRREMDTPEFRIAGTGGLIFLVVAGYQTSGGVYQLEHFAMLIFVGAVGYMVARRMLEGERRLVAVSKELDLARRIQSSILPRALPAVSGLDIAAGYFPSSKIGGDFYDFETIAGKGLGLIIADVSGHGVPAALVASMVKIAFAAESGEMRQPAQVLTRLNRTLCGKFAGAYVTACCAYIEPGVGVLRFACAGHPAPWILRSGGALEPLHASGLLLAFDPHARYDSCEVPVHPGDRLAFYSDGLMEAIDAKGAFFGEMIFPRLMAGSGSMPPGAFLDHTIASLRAWVHPPGHLQDDVTMVVVDMHPG